MIKIYSYKQLLRYECFENKSLINIGSAESAVLGATLNGTAGAIIGASGPTRTIDDIHAVDVVIYVNDLQEPSVTVPFLRRI